MSIQKFFIGIAVLLLSTAPYTCAYTVQFISNTAHSTDLATMNTNLGVTGYTIENFEDTSLVDGLSIRYDSDTPITTLANVYAPIHSPNTWDGSYALVNDRNNLWGNSSWAMKMGFYIQGGTTSFGVGLANFQSDATHHTLFINGNAWGTIDSLPNYATGAYLLNGYLKIDAASGELINSISLRNDSSIDGLVFDYVAFGAVPEPNSLALLGLAAILLFFRRQK